MKNIIDILNNVKLILYPYSLYYTDVLFYKLLPRTLDVVPQLQPCHARRVSKKRQRENGKVLESLALEIRQP